jgi:predicted CXXCH cytochrome family protein
MRKRVKIALFVALATAGAAFYGQPYLVARGTSKLRHLPGKTSDGHAQIELACDVCHTRFGGVKNDACTSCHGRALEAENDSHPEGKFIDPRNAERVAALDARQCSTCHQEHRGAETSRSGVTMARDFCGSCHKDIAEERPDHKGLGFDTCTNAGCHNFHDNRALTEDFLGKHLGEPKLSASPAVPARTSRGHVDGGVACASCHERQGVWEAKPGFAPCRKCHEAEAATFDGGKHGMRPAAGLPAMVPALARRPMQASAADHSLGCGTCHDVHSVDTRRAAVDACLGCHDDEHSKAYKSGPHFALWRAELAGGPPGSGVSCATCHLPRDTHGRVDHDQNADLRPVTKMVRAVCASCHGVGFALDALADAALVRRNFDKEPAAHVATLDMVEARARAKDKKRKAKEETEK